MFKVYTDNDFYAVIDNEQVITTPDIDMTLPIMTSVFVTFSSLFVTGLTLI